MTTNNDLLEVLLLQPLVFKDHDDANSPLRLSHFPVDVPAALRDLTQEYA